MENNLQKSNKVAKFIVTIGLLVVIGLVVFLVLEYKKEEPKSQNPNSEVKLETKDGKPIASIELKSIAETLNADSKMKIVFTGKRINDTSENEGIYQYTALITIDGKKVEDNIFTNVADMAIWSNNMTSSFEVYKIGKFYVLYSKIANLCTGSNILILTESGSVTKSYRNVYGSVNSDNTLSISYNDENNCEGIAKKYTVTLNNGFTEELEDSSNSFKLVNEIETLQVDAKMKIDFTGKKVDNVLNENMYQYTAIITLDNKAIASNIFTNSNDMAIWSNNMAADFKVVKINNYYVIVSFVANQCTGYNILIVDELGNIAKSYRDVWATVGTDSLEISYNDSLDCNAIARKTSVTFANGVVETDIAQ